MQMSTMTIREVRPGDEGAIDELLGGLDAAVALPALVHRWRRHPGCRGLGRPSRARGRGRPAGFIADRPVGHAVLVPTGDGRAEVAFEVAAQWRRHGIASALLERLLDEAADRGLREVYADVLPENADMLAVLREHGEHGESRDGGVVTVTLPAPHRT